jgi:hypothetical protein
MLAGAAWLAGCEQRSINTDPVRFKPAIKPFRSRSDQAHGGVITAEGRVNTREADCQSAAD